MSRGMECDRESLVSHLCDVGYYRLSGYWHIYKEENDTFREGTCFSEVWTIYIFDRQFRLVVLDAIERVEVYFRTQLAHELAKKTGPFGFTDKKNLPRLSDGDYERLLNTCREKHTRSREPFIVHFREKYGDTHALPPYWMLVNTMDFGQTLTLYRGAPVEIRNALAAQLGLSAKVLESWLFALNTVRNICAHHGRLWNRVIGTKPIIPKASKDVRWHKPYEVSSERVFGILTILSYLLAEIAPQTKWRNRLFALLESHPSIDRRKMGFFKNWESCPFWAKYLP